jgi:hypothetical protein
MLNPTFQREVRQRSSSVECSQKHGLNILMGVLPSSATYRYETPLERRGPVVEEDDAPDHNHSQAPPSHV